MSVGLAIVVGAVVGLAFGVGVSLLTGGDALFAPEIGLVLGAFAGWLAGRKGRPT